MHGVIVNLKLKELLRVKERRLLEFSPNLRLGDGIKPKKLDKLKNNLQTKPLLTDVVILIISENPSDQLELIQSKELAQPFYTYHTLRVIGIAKDQGEAIGLVQKITEECLTLRGDCSLKEYVTWQS